MITHEEARELVDRIYVHTDWETKEKLVGYISQQETLQAEHEALKKDVARYVKLSFIKEYGRMTLDELHEHWVLYCKLSKVGKEE